jgi:peptidoglycan/LPS O-acetylase OafA/YrhL
VDSSETQGPMFSRGGRIALAVSALLFGLMLLLWASDQGELWKYAPAMFCFAIFGAIVLPPKLSRWCGYGIALAILVLCAQVAIDKFDGGSVEYVIGVGKILLTFGLPALVFLAKGRAPFQFGAVQQSTSERDEDG